MMLHKQSKRCGNGLCVLPQDEEEGGIDTIEDTGPPLDTSTIHWRPSKEGITLLELFGGVAIGLVVVLQVGIKVTGVTPLSS